MIKKPVPVTVILALCGLSLWQYDTQRSLREAQQQRDDLRSQIVQVDRDRRVLVPDGHIGFEALERDEEKLNSMAGIK